MVHQGRPFLFSAEGAEATRVQEAGGSSAQPNCGEDDQANPPRPACGKVRGTLPPAETVDVSCSAFKCESNTDSFASSPR